jgi:hypothetical protein
MKTLARLASALIAASAFVLPASAMAENKASSDHHAQKESAFPMKADLFKKLVEGKIGKLKGHFKKGVAKRSLSHQQKTEITKSLDFALKDLHAAVDKVSSDGVVTKGEAKRIKTLSEKLRSKVREELKGKHANAKAKGQKRAKKASHKKVPAKKAHKDAPAKDES